MRAEQRLLPVNAFVALFLPNDIWPPLLGQAGFRLAGLEVPITTAQGTTTLDAVAVHDETNTLLVAEAKSGANIDTRQARRLAALDPSGIVRTASVPLTGTARPTVELVYVCNSAHLDRILHGLRTAAVGAPVLAVSSSRVQLKGAAPRTPLLGDALSEPIPMPGPPPRIVRFDVESTTEEFVPAVLAELVAGQSHQWTILTVRALAEAVVPQYGLYGKRAQRTFRKQVDEAARRLSHQHADSYRYRPRTEGHDEPAVEILHSPEALDPRGRTQAYQAIARRSSRRRRPMPPPEGQLQLDLVTRELEHLGEADQGDEEEEG